MEVNRQNVRKARRNNKTGVLGVQRRGRRFISAVVLNRRRYLCGTFDTAEEAHAAYVIKKRQLHEGCTL
jgi:hypothetical protein